MRAHVHTIHAAARIVIAKFLGSSRFHASNTCEKADGESPSLLDTRSLSPPETLLVLTWQLIYRRRPFTWKDISDTLSLPRHCFRDHGIDVSSDGGDRAVPSSGHAARPS